jgi:Crp-like helix-turn-helix domain
MRKENLLLAALPEDERKRISPYLNKVGLDFQQVLIEPDQEITHIYFPCDVIISSVQEMSDGDTVETGLTGLEGFVGVQLWLRARSTPTRTLVQVRGETHHMRAADFIRHVRQTNSVLNELCGKYTHAFLVMTSQTAACNRSHPVNERLCRWRLCTKSTQSHPGIQWKGNKSRAKAQRRKENLENAAALCAFARGLFDRIKHFLCKASLAEALHNRIGRDEFPIRQDFIAQMLGVHRPTVSTAANMLQQAGLITYSRGQMRIVDPEGLKNGSCECLEIMEKQFAAVFDSTQSR